jgi:soluble lytic murein transglycosylase-like protein
LDTGQASVTQVKLVGVALACLAIGAGGHCAAGEGRRAIWIKATKEYREQVQLRTIGPSIPLAVLDEIRKAGEDVPSILALIMCESSGRPNAKVTDPADPKRIIAYGLMGVRPQHALDRGYSVEDLANPVINVRIGIEVLKEIRTRWPRELDSISSWNCGEVAWKASMGPGKKPPIETQGHWRKYQEYRDAYRRYIDTGEGME